MKPDYIVLTGGGTGGHTFTAVSIAEILTHEARQLGKGIRFRYLGSKKGLEANIAVEKGWEFTGIPSGKLRRYFSWRNFSDAFLILFGFIKAFFLLLFQRPKIVIGTGGYVAVPVILAAAILRIPIRLHEQTCVVGLANKICLKLAGHLYTGFENPKGVSKNRVTWVGTPIRKNLFDQNFPDRKTSLSQLGFKKDLPFIYITGGAQGAHRINKIIHDNLEKLAAKYLILHQCGSSTQEFNQEVLQKAKTKLNESDQSNYLIREFVTEELPGILRHCDVVISRSGAGSVNEFWILEKPSVLIPLPNSAGGEQKVNADFLAKESNANVINEDELDIQILEEALIDQLKKINRIENLDISSKYKAIQGKIVTYFSPDSWKKA